jgi:hypothetical protein
VLDEKIAHLTRKMNEAYTRCTKHQARRVVGGK